MTNAYVGGLVLSILLIAALIFALREFWCWYFKINRIVNALEELVKIERQREVKSKAAEVASGGM